MLLVLASLLLAVAAESPRIEQGYDNTEYGNERHREPGASNVEKDTLENFGLLDTEVADQLNGKGWLDAVPGTPERDYPNLNKVPETSFTCEGKTVGGYYADVETRCQVFHVCNTGNVKSSFLCPGGSIFNQKYFVCDWWYDFECDDAIELYHLNVKNNREGEASSSKSEYTKNDDSLKNDNRYSSSISHNGRSNIKSDGYDLSLAGTGQGASGYTGDKESHGYRRNFKNIRSNENRPSGNYDGRDSGKQRISNNTKEDAGRIEGRWKNHDKTNEYRETRKNYSVQRDSERSIYYTGSKDESLNGYEESHSRMISPRILSSRDNGRNRFNDRADREEDKKKDKYLGRRNEENSYNERTNDDTGFDKEYEKNDYNTDDENGRNNNSNRFSNTQGRNTIDDENNFGERSSKPGIIYFYQNENVFERSDPGKDNDSDKVMNHSLESFRDYRKRQCDENGRKGESSNNIISEFRKDRSKSIFATDKRPDKNIGRKVQRVTGGLQGRIGNGYPGPNRELPGSNAIAGTIAPFVLVESQDVPNDRLRGIDSLNFNSDYISNEYPSGTPRHETGSPEFSLNANNGYPGIRPNPNTNGILSGEGQTSLATKTPSGTTSPGEITSIGTGYSNDVASKIVNFNEHNTGDYKGDLQRDENYFFTSNVPSFGKRNRIGHNQGYLPPESATNEKDNKGFLKNAKNNFEKFHDRNDPETGFEDTYYPSNKNSDNDGDGRHTRDRTRYLPAL